MIVTVTVSAGTPAAHVRRAIREAIWDSHIFEGALPMNIRKVQPAGPTLELAAKAAKAWGGKPAVMPKPRRPAQETPALLAAMQTQEKTNGS